MDISVIIISWNVKGLLEKCLESLYAYTAGVGFEVIVVDNASSDGTVEMLESNFDVIPTEASRRRAEWRNPLQPANGTYKGSLGGEYPLGMTIKLIRNSKNLGFAAANNIAIKESSGKYVLLLNPDTEFTENSLKKVFDKMESDTSIGVLGCKLLNPDGTLQPSVRRFPRVRDIAIIFFKLYKLFPSLLNYYLAKDFDYARESEADQVMGAFMCIRRSAIEKLSPPARGGDKGGVGALDDKYFIWFEEVDFCRRAKRAGFKVVYWPGTSIIHHGGQSFGQAGTVQKQWWFFRSAWRYLTK
ncbi:MAG: glycosyltransferase family 2 protein [Parcubacteria group bacterium]|nr:glycosyltransferase family 2 protein [Parcubacteria group bacterium]